MDSMYYGDYYDYGYAAAATATSMVGGFLIFGIVMWLIAMAASILMIVSLWKIFVKLGKPGWYAIVPIYNIYQLCLSVGVEWWYLLLMCVPIVQFYAMYVIYDSLAKKFGKSTGFTIGIILVPYVFLPMLAFGKNNNVVGESVTVSEPISSSFQSAPVSPVGPSPVAQPVQQPVNPQPMNSAPSFGPAPMQPQQPVAPVQPMAAPQPVEMPEQPKPAMSVNEAPSFGPAPMGVPQQPVNPQPMNSAPNFGPSPVQPTAPVQPVQQPVNNVPNNNINNPNNNGFM
jgi:outer membrane biosynthesis protein TonB